MITLTQVKSALASVDKALQVHQENREEMMRLDSRNVLFNNLLNARTQLAWSIENLEKLSQPD